MSKLADLRVQADLTQAQLAKKLGASRRSVAAWELYGVVPLPIYRQKLARIFKVPESAFEFESASEGEPMR